MKLIDWFKSKLGNKEKDSNYKLESSYPSNPIQEPELAKPEDNTDSDSLREFGEKARQFLEETGKEVVSQGKEVAEELKDKWRALDENTREFREEVKEKAHEALDKVNKLIDKTIHSGEEKDAEEQKIDQDKDGFADAPPDFGKSVTESHSGFFEKAEKFLDESKKSPNSPTEPSTGTSSQPTLELPQDDDKV